MMVPGPVRPRAGDRKNSGTTHGKSITNAFTLVEMLVVISIILIVAVVALPAITSLSKGASRRSAVSLVMAAIDQTRAQAIGQSAPCYFVFANNDAKFVFTPAPGKPAEDYRYRAFAVFQEVYIPPKADATADVAARPYQMLLLRPWTLLPEGVAFRPPAQTVNATPGTPPPQKTVYNATNPPLTRPFFFQPGNANVVLPFVKFNATGGIETIGEINDTTAADYAHVKIFEGFVDANGTAVATNAARALADETITLSLFTGRAKREEIHATN